ncbi:MAG: hypothetical protein DRN26_00175 [Thermoplasmata archaeon]|nr:MAG: hypothetical protein DRN26_00175 [Thermoplasmata archaeon]
MKLSKAEASLLMYLETRAVDHKGWVDTSLMNNEDFAIVKKWNKEGYVKFGRVASSDITYTPGRYYRLTHWCELSDAAWGNVAQLRRERAERGLQSRIYRRIEEIET